MNYTKKIGVVLSLMALVLFSGCSGGVSLSEAFKIISNDVVSIERFEFREFTGYPFELRDYVIEENTCYYFIEHYYGGGSSFGATKYECYNNGTFLISYEWNYKDSRPIIYELNRTIK